MKYGEVAVVFLATLRTSEGSFPSAGSLSNLFVDDSDDSECFKNWVYGYSEGAGDKIGKHMGETGSAEECQLKCQEDPDCYSFLWETGVDWPNEKNCYLKSAEQVRMAFRQETEAEDIGKIDTNFCNSQMAQQCSTNHYNCVSCPENDKKRCVWRSHKHRSGPKHCEEPIIECEDSDTTEPTTTEPTTTEATTTEATTTEATTTEATTTEATTTEATTTEATTTEATKRPTMPEVVKSSSTTKKPPTATTTEPEGSSKTTETEASTEAGGSTMGTKTAIAGASAGVAAAAAAGAYAYRSNSLPSLSFEMEGSNAFVETENANEQTELAGEDRFHQ